MEKHLLLSVVYAFLVIQNATSQSSGHDRQKRCIVIQKQSGTHGDSAEGEEADDYRRPQPKAKADKTSHGPLGLHDKSYEAEEISPEFQRLRKRFERLRLKKINRYSEPTRTGAV